MTDFAEPEAEWEAYIPLRPEDAERSAARNREIWNEAVRRLEQEDGNA